jgi:hypothetical protein
VASTHGGHRTRSSRLQIRSRPGSGHFISRVPRGHRLQVATVVEALPKATSIALPRLSPPVLLVRRLANADYIRHLPRSMPPDASIAAAELSRLHTPFDELRSAGASTGWRTHASPRTADEISFPARRQARLPGVEVKLARQFARSVEAGDVDLLPRLAHPKREGWCGRRGASRATAAATAGLVLQAEVACCRPTDAVVWTPPLLRTQGATPTSMQYAASPAASS